MGESQLFQSSFRRAVADTIHAPRRNPWFFWSIGIVMVALGGFLGTVYTPEGSGRFISALCPTAGVILGAIIGIIIIFIINLILAPYRQRNEARKLVKQLRKPSEGELTDIIRTLQAETLASKNNNGEERSYSFAQVFLATADQLSIGVPSILFEGKIKKGLGINEDGNWFFPYEDDGITRLIGVLYQNALVERRNEEYQCMVRDYPQDINDITLDIINKGNMFRSKPSQHLEKGTEVKYYLLPLGSRVIQRLRQRSVVDKKGFQLE